MKFFAPLRSWLRATLRHENFLFAGAWRATARPWHLRPQVSVFARHSPLLTGVKE